MVEGEKSLTPAGNVKAPSLTTMTSWVLEAWRGLPKEMVARSFKKCGISNSIDGTEDDILWEEEANPKQGSEDDESEDEDVYDDKLTEEQWRSLFGESDDEDGQCSTPGEEFHVNPMKEVEPRNLWIIAAEARVGDYVTFRVHQYFTVFEVPKLADTW